jgi:hypothetical protein
MSKKIWKNKRYGKHEFMAQWLVNRFRKLKVRYIFLTSKTHPATVEANSFTGLKKDGWRTK